MTAFTRNGNGELPSVVSNVGGLVLDIVGANGNRLIIQIPANALAGVPAGATSVDLASVTLTAEQYAALGGGIREFDVRVTAFDGDSEPQDPDGGVINGFRFNGAVQGDISDNRTETTSPDGEALLAEREGFGDGTLDTSWMRFSGQAATDFYDSIDPVSRTITITYFDLNGAQDAIDWTAGLDPSQANSAPVQTFVPTAGSTGSSSIEGAAATITVNAIDPADDRALTYAFDLNDDGVIDQTGSSNSFTFTPTDEGSYRIRYYVTDADGVTITRFRTFNIENADPTAANDAATASEGGAVTIDALANDRDPGADTLAITGASVASGGGSVSIVDNRLVFVTDASFEDLGVGESRQVVIDYAISDGDGGSAAAQAIVTVTGVNDAPVAAADNASTFENAAITVDVLANDGDVDGDALAVTGARLVSGGGLVSVVDNAVRFDPGAAYDSLRIGESATVTIAYDVADGNSGSTSSTVTITVTGTNDGPVAAADAASTAENAAITVDVLANDGDVDGDALAVTGARLVSGAGDVSVVGNAVRFDPGAAYDSLGVGDTATVTIAYDIADGNGGVATSTLTVTVTGANDGPVARADTASTSENATVTVDVLVNDSDADGDALTVTAARINSGAGSVSVVGNVVRFDPGAAFDSLAVGQTETVEIAYDVSDGEGGVVSSTLTVTVTGTNDGPIANADAATVAEGGIVSIDALVSDSDVDGDTLTLTGASVAGGGSVTIADGALLFDGGDDFEWLGVGESATALIDYSIADGNGGTAASQVTVTVTGVNDAPVARDDAAAVGERGSVTIDALANDSDPDANDRLAISEASVNGGGSVSIVDNRLVFDAGTDFDALEDGESATVTIDYLVSDGHGGQARASVEVTVSGRSDPVNVINGTRGFDWLVGTGGRDVIDGRDGHDILFGNGGNDVLRGGGGWDGLFGGSGDDVLIGGSGWDLLVGGEGADLFVFGRDAEHDVIADFEYGVDRIQLDGSSYRGGVFLDPDCDGIGSLVLLHSGGSITLTGVTQPLSTEQLFG